MKIKFFKESLCGIVVNMLECNIIVNKFKFQLCDYIHFWTNILGKGMNFLIPPAIGWIAGHIA